MMAEVTICLHSALHWQFRAHVGAQLRVALMIGPQCVTRLDVFSRWSSEVITK